MSRYIDKDLLINKLEEKLAEIDDSTAIYTDFDEGATTGFCLALNIIKDIPEADVVDRKHAHKSYCRDCRLESKQIKPKRS